MTQASLRLGIGDLDDLAALNGSTLLDLMDRVTGFAVTQDSVCALPGGC